MSNIIQYFQIIPKQILIAQYSLLITKHNIRKKHKRLNDELSLLCFLKEILRN